MFPTSPTSPRPGWRPRLALFGVAAAAALAGCAQLPDAVTTPDPRPLGAYAAAESFRAPAIAWPESRWWQAYGDAQLDALVDEALAGSPDLAAAAARLERAASYSQVAGSALKPQVTVGASATQDRFSKNHITPASILPTGWEDVGQATFTIGWELDFWGANRAALAAATSEAEAARAELAQARLLLSSAVAAQYAELGRLYANRDSAARSVQVRTRTAELVAERFRNGLETRGNVRQADAGRAAAEGALLAIDERIALQRNRLAALLGAGPDRGLSITPPALKLDRGFGLPAELGAELLGRRPDVAAARLRAEAQAKRIDVATAAFYPNVNLSAMVGLQSLGLDNLTRSGSTMGSIGPAISLPVFTGGRLRGQLRGAQSAYAEAVASYDATVTHALQDVADAAVSLKALAPRLAKADEALAAADEAHRVARERYDGGLATYLEVLSAEDTMLASLNAQADLRAGSLALDVALQRALGGGWRDQAR
ncbi:efflux transporter outer membrane subunit [Rubrivivax gelatinosus]|uniref:Outer membrane efflux protein n=2 Tax=Rubrivivax gelatinosus TaxID=28068 RepID=I0HTZ0_RUBGI|nr:efflux transporter outer membrane subunit [Rubrivivax gelatinosus]BAL96477.1 outer membrane efflux protein [Rubrivivax gelatinosus IL144]